MTLPIIKEQSQRERGREKEGGRKGEEKRRGWEGDGYGKDRGGAIMAVEKEEREEKNPL